MAVDGHPMSALKGTQAGRDLMANVRAHKGGGGKLDTAERKSLPAVDFAIPSKAPGPGSYPIPDLAHARDALARVAANGTPAEQAQVKAAVYKKFPQLAKKASAPQPRGKKYDDIIAAHAARIRKVVP